MTIAKGQPWGSPGALGVRAPVVHGDRELSRLLEDESGRLDITEVGLLGGDLCKTVGGRGDQTRLRTPEAMRLPIDVGLCWLDGVEHRFVAHLVARRSWWRGRVVAVMNAQWIGQWDVAPRSHPNDGLLDVFDGDMALDDRFKARRRLVTGTHVPHPRITQSRVAEVNLTFDSPQDVWLDGERVGRATEVVARAQPDALTIVV